ncbi:MAG: hypothetical protein GOMPHAMPRED_000824 [Gomphillus americanus]|uniref:Uncharacterized protein n=1 Tax=Gomphillus americanus TaxID=1940652 RepID=A0A8H3F453_9LECA|nr:MAG: hypothetical protein GOMPHAMPRED_000824 [Gomphillus americanus]
MHSVRLWLISLFLLTPSLQATPPRSRSPSISPSQSPNTAVPAGGRNAGGDGLSGASRRRDSFRGSPHPPQNPGSAQNRILSETTARRRVAQVDNVRVGQTPARARDPPNPLDASLNNPSAFRVVASQTPGGVKLKPPPRTPRIELPKFKVKGPGKRRGRLAPTLEEDMAKVGPGKKYPTIERLRADRLSKARYCRRKRDENEAKTGYRTTAKIRQVESIRLARSAGFRQQTIAQMYPLDRFATTRASAERATHVLRPVNLENQRSAAVAPPVRTPQATGSPNLQNQLPVWGRRAERSSRAMAHTMSQDQLLVWGGRAERSSEVRARANLQDQLPAATVSPTRISQSESDSLSTISDRSFRPERNGQRADSSGSNRSQGSQPSVGSRNPLNALKDYSSSDVGS